MKKIIFVFIGVLLFSSVSKAQMGWKEVTSDFGIQQPSVKVFEWEGTFNDSAFRAFYVQVNTKDASLKMGADTTLYRRLTPTQFYERLQQPLLVVNASFFEFKNNTNLNVIVKEGKTVAYNVHTISGKGKDSLTYLHVLPSAIGMNQDNQLDIGYTYTDSSLSDVFFQSSPLVPFRDSNAIFPLTHERLANTKPWKQLQWAIGGGPVLMREGRIQISNEEERKFAGKGISDRHPRTAMGYTQKGELIILVIQGRMKGVAVGATLPETAAILSNLGCYEAINLDGGGSSCMLINGKETIKPSDSIGERPIPAVFYVK